MNILISGSSGLIGTALVQHWAGRPVTRLLRSPSTTQAHWDIAAQTVDLRNCPKPDIVILLNGENIGDSRWTPKRKQQLLDSRLQSTELLVNTLLDHPHKPHTVICASAIGYYGNRGDETLTEASTPARNEFTSQLCLEWEARCQPLVQVGIRVVNLRTGIVLSRRGGALPKMLPAFKMGLGGPIGDGQQWMSWIDLEDVVNAIHFIAYNQSLYGPINLTAPNPVRNREFSKTLAGCLSRPCLLPMPSFMVKALFGEMGEALLLSGAKVVPDVLQASGFQFKHPNLESSLCAQLK